MASKPIVKTEDGGWKIVDRPPTAISLAEIIGKTLVGDQKKKSERRPRSPATHRGRLENFVGEEAPEARAGPRNPDAFYRGEEAGAVPKSQQLNEMLHFATENIKNF